MQFANEIVFQTPDLGSCSEIGNMGMRIPGNGKFSWQNVL
jgi:hypothetical protein